MIIKVSRWFNRALGVLSLIHVHFLFLGKLFVGTHDNFMSEHIYVALHQGYGLC